jgi:hypothetical protein
VLPNGAWCRSVAVDGRHDADVGRGGPPPKRSACSSLPGDASATRGLDAVDDVVIDGFAEDERLLPDDEPQPPTASAPEIATAAVTGASKFEKRTGHHSVSLDSGRSALHRLTGCARPRRPCSRPELR